MVGFGHAQILGMVEDVGKAAEKEAEAIRKAGTDPEKLTAPMLALRDQMVALNAQQEDLKRQLKRTTDLYVATKRRLYNVTSGVLDVEVAAVGKNGPSGRNLQRLRSRVRRPMKRAAVEVPAVR